MPSFPTPSQYKIDFAPLADPAAVVLARSARFSVLTPRLLRMEFSPAGVFEDHPSQAFWYRQQPVPPFQVEHPIGGGVVIRTQYLTLTYVPQAGEAADDRRVFTKKNLSVIVHATGQTWHYGDRDFENLGGTTRTLDGVNGAARLEPGLVSPKGWAVVDDSSSLVFNPDSWLEPRQQPANRDLYFFGHGHEYRTALQDFIAHHIPLAVAVIDMDWHITHTGNDSTGWTGYTWNRQLFPDPPAFLSWLHQQGLKASLNVHPAEGVYPHEEAYPAMARRMGQDPSRLAPVPFDIADPQFTTAYFEELHHPLEAQGIDFWWIDWQQGDRTTMPGLDPLYWLNHLHFYDLARRGRRPFIFSRWPGLGGHRYPIGFSGDTFISWETLAYQPVFTATAANVAYGWWSHDIGGHMRGWPEPELYTRWVQYGLFSPILRLHSTKNPLLERRPWGYDAETERVTSAALRLRHAFIPYLYSMAWRSHRTACPLVLPMYYLYPEASEAYRCPGQYWFGSELLAAPYVRRRDPSTGLAQHTVWLPEGDWFDFFSGEHFSGGRWHGLHGELDQIPVFARAGAIVPLTTEVVTTEEDPALALPRSDDFSRPLALATDPTGVSRPSSLEVHLFLGASNAFELYEDDGETQAYTRGVCAITHLAQSWQGDRLHFSIDPVEGDPSLVPARRAWTLVFHGLRRPQPGALSLRLDGDPLAAAWTYDEPAERLTLPGLELTPTSRLEVELHGAGSLLSRRDRRLEKARRMLFQFPAEADLTRELWFALPELLAGKLSLLQWAHRLTPGQLEALRSVVE